MRVAVFGSGLMGSAIASDLAASKEVDEIAVFDVDRKRLDSLARVAGSTKLTIKVHDVRSRTETLRLLKKFDVGVGALPHQLTQYIIQSTVQAGVNFVDLIFGWRFEDTKIHSAAKKRGVTIIPACGLGPGLTNILAKTAADQMVQVEEVHIKTGGVPERPKPPLNYRVVFSFEAVLEEYMRKAKIIKNGRITEAEALSGLETVTFPPPIGECECFYTDGLSTLIHTIKGVREMDEKTIRWPGHMAQIRTLIDCGLLDTKPVPFDGKPIVPRRFMAKVLGDRLNLGDERDLTLMRIDVTGRTPDGRVHHWYEMIDHYDDKLKMTSMARTTAFPCSIAAQLLGTGAIAEKGLVPPELVFKGELLEKLLDYLAHRNIRIDSNRTVVNT